MAARLGDAHQLLAQAFAAFATARRGDHAGVIALLQPIEAFCVGRHRHAIDDPSVAHWHDLYIEALIAVGDLGRAGGVLRRFARVAEELRRRSALVTVARVRGRLEIALGRTDAANAAFLAGMAEAVGLPLPFHVAQLELAYGEFLRRTRRRTRAVAVLSAARGRFERLGAAPWVDRCARELAACGRPVPAPAAPSGWEVLTARERAVVGLVIQGNSNRAVAEQLVVSVKTVEYHLGKVFVKLNVSSRTQLIARLTPRSDEGIR
jgi:DNA-binding CsgD family transcriptional regulator